MTTQRAVNSLLQDLTCPITMELFEDPVTVPCCGKAFSRDALIRHLMNEERCPLCNGDLSGFDASTVARNVLLAGMVDTLQNNRSTQPQQEILTQPNQPHRWSASLVPIPNSTMAEFTLSLEDSKFSARPSLFIAVLDCSGSMSGGPERQVRSALQHIVSMAAHSPCVKLVILSYASGCVEIQRPESYVIGGGTNFRGAFAMVQSVLSRYICSDDPQLATQPNNVSTVSIAFLTDGEDTCGGRDRLVNEFQTMLRRQWGTNPLSVHAMGFGQSCDRVLLEDMRKAGTVEGMFRYAEPTDNDDALCQKLTGIFEISSQASTVPLALSIGEVVTNIRFPIDQYRHGQYRQWMEVDEKNPPVIVVQSQLDQSITIPLVISPPNDEIFQRWLGKVTDELASSVMDLGQLNVSTHLKELYCALLLQKLDALNNKVTDESIRERLKYLETQVDEFKIGNAINLSKLSDLRFASQFKPTTAVPTMITSVLPPEPKRIDEGPSSERPLKHYSFSNVNKGRNVLQESIMALPCDVLTDAMKSTIDQSSLDDVMHKDVDGNTSWMLAAYAGHSKILGAILKRHANLPLEQTNNDNETAVSLAIKKRGFHHSLGALLDAGATIPRHKTMERFAIENNYTITAQIISSFGEGSTNVDESMTVEYIQYVFNRVKSKTFDVQQFFGVALAKRMMPLVKELLEEFKAEPTIDMLAKFGIPKKPDTPDMEQYLQLTRMMVQSRPQLIKERTTDDGESALSCAAQRGSLPHVEYFVSSGADLEQTNAKGNTALYASCFMGFPMIAEYLLDHGANLWATNDKGNSLLYGPCTRGSKAVAELLISRGLGVDHVNQNGDTLVLICCRNGQHEMLELILNYATREYAERVAHIDGFNAMMASAEQDRPECIRVCHEYALDLNQQTAKDNAILGLATPLHICSYYGRANAMRMLLKLGANPDMVDANGQTPLHIAVIQGHVDLIRILRSHGANLSVKDLSGNVPMAYCRDRLDVRKVLINPVMEVMMKLARGEFPPEDEKLACDALSKFSGVVGCLTTKDVVDVQDFDGSTPLIQAVIFGRPQLIQTLIQLGADPLKCNEFNMSSLAWAQWNRNKRIESLLKCDDHPTPQWTKLNQLDESSKRLLFMGACPKNYTSVPRSGIAQRMEEFINTPTETRIVLINDVVDSTATMLGQNWVKEFDHPTILHRIWDSKVFAVNKSISQTIPIPDLLTISLFTNNPFIHQSINQSILTQDSSKRVFVQQLYRSLFNLPTYGGESYIGSSTVQRKLYPKGKEFVWNHFVSSSALWRVALENTPSFTSKSRLGTVFIIKSKTGRYVGPYSQFSFDAEVILLPGTKFKVTNWYHGDPIALGQSNIREHTFGVKEYDNERLNLQQMMDSNKALIIELTEVY